MKTQKIKKIVLAYSGGLDTSVIIPWLKENYHCKVIAMIANIGQEEKESLPYIKKKALKTGAAKVYCLDLRKEFIENFIYPCLKAGAVYEGKYLLGTSMARPLIAQKQVEIALRENADALAHGATGKGNDQVRFELTYMALAPHLKVIAPWKDDKWHIQSREDAIDYAQKHKIPIIASKKKIYSEDMNIMHLSHEGDELEDPNNEPNDRIYQFSSTLEKAPNKATYITINFKKGIPVMLNNKRISSVQLLSTLNKIGGKNAIGQADLVENRLVGMKSRGVYETPGCSILYFAHQELENLVFDRQTTDYKAFIAQKYAELVYNGQWFTPLLQALNSFVDSTQKVVTGKVRLKLYKGNIVPAGVTSPYSLYDNKISSFGKDGIYNQKDAVGFINLYGLPLKIRSLKKINTMYNKS